MEWSLTVYVNFYLRREIQMVNTHSDFLAFLCLSQECCIASINFKPLASHVYSIRVFRIITFQLDPCSCLYEGIAAMFISQLNTANICINNCWILLNRKNSSRRTIINRWLLLKWLRRSPWWIVDSSGWKNV